MHEYDDERIGAFRLDAWNIADALVEHVRAGSSQDVSLVAAYGSLVSSTSHARSDLDLFFIPESERGMRAALQFIIDGIGYDFWPLSWERIGRIAALEEPPMIAVIADARVLYARSDEAVDRFEDLRRQISTALDSDQSITRSTAVEAQINDAASRLASLQLNEIDGSSLHIEAETLVTSLMHALALMNRSYLRRSWVQCREQIREFKDCPNGLDELLGRYLSARTREGILSACADLYAAVRGLAVQSCLGSAVDALTSTRCPVSTRRSRVASTR